MFDPQTFMDQTLDEGSTSQIPCPEGEWEGVIAKEPTFEEFTSKRNQNTYTKMSVFIEISNPEVTSVTAREPTTVRYQAFLDLTSSGGLDMGQGKNLGLNRLREAVGLNKPGFRFSDLVGKSLIVEVTHRADPDDDSKVYDEVKKVRAV